MARPSQNTDQRLIEAAGEILKHSGLSGMNLRQVAAKAGVNLGMFHYHFKNKDQFTRKVLQESYERFFKEFSLESGKDGGAREQLRGAVLTLVKFVRDHRRMFLGILQDVLRKDKVVLDFLKTNIPRHGLVIVGLARRCQKEGSIRKAPLPSVMSHLLGANMAPILILTLLEHLDIKDIRFLPVKIFGKTLISDKALSARVDFVLESLGPKSKR